MKQKPAPYVHQYVTLFRRSFAAFNGKKGNTGAAALYGGKHKHTVLPYGKLTDRGYL